MRRIIDRRVQHVHWRTLHPRLLRQESAGLAEAFAERFRLGGVILFDYSCQTRQYDNNIEVAGSAARALRGNFVAAFRPMLFIDQEGGLVRRLKETRGFQPLPSAKDFNRLAPGAKREILAASFTELRQLGIHYNFAPVIDVDYNPDNPNIGRIERAYSGDIAEVEADALLVNEIAQKRASGFA